MIDVHCHLNFEAFRDDFDDIIKNAKKEGVEIIINTGTKLDSSRKAVELSKKYENLYAIVGIHPHHADKSDLNLDWEKELEKLAKMPKVLAIGEIGMDYYQYKSNGIVDPKLQRDIFEKQIELAHKVNLPIQIHNRHAGKEIIEILKHHRNLLKTNNPGMFHCFAGNMETLRSVLQMGFYIGFDGNITYKGLAPGETTTLSDLAIATPLDRIVTETDSPYLSPVPYRGSRNVPSHVIIVGEFLSQIKHISFDKVKAQTTQNAKALFGL